MTISYITAKCPCCSRTIRCKVVTSLFSPQFDLDGYCKHLIYDMALCEGCGFACLPEHVEKITCGSKPTIIKDDPYLTAAGYYESVNDFYSAGKCLKYAYWKTRENDSDKAGVYLELCIEMYSQYLLEHKDFANAVVLCDLLRQSEKYEEATEFCQELKSYINDDQLLDRLNKIEESLTKQNGR